MGKIKELLYDVDVDEQGAFIVEYKEQVTTTMKIFLQIEDLL
mgnify:CR=1 FL=1